LIWSAQQEAALAAVGEWYDSGEKPWFYLAGYAGSGKSTLAKHLAASIGGNTVFAAFTGKAAEVMVRMGCVGATTIHRLIYMPREKSRERLRELHDELKAEKSELTRERIRRLITIESKLLRAPSWDLSTGKGLRNADLIVIDECSMVGRGMAEDLLSFGVPVLVLGDPAQLPPVAGQGFFTSQTPDVMLTEVHRQALESPILRLATDIREGKPILRGDYGRGLEVIERAEVVSESVPEYGQVIVGRNKTRIDYNRKIRRIIGRTDPLPIENDKVICLRNNHDLGIMNGQTWTVLDRGPSLEGDDVCELVLRSDDDRVIEVDTWSALFLGNELGPWDEDNKDVQKFDYGNAITCHKAQGSQYGTVMVFDESFCFRKNAQQWAYTACTRASDQLTWVKMS
tara:strand:- start:1379 stop:2575 length:1197 start_codon:yes stop_codon:yes gene_type:complete